MPDFSLNLVIYLTSFLAIWAGSGLIVSSVNKLSQKLHVPAFLISFMILGVLTSTPELAVGITSISSGNPSIFVGNLLGGIPVIFLLILPLIAIFGRGIKLNHYLSHWSIFFSLLITLAPFVVILDKKVTSSEAVFLIGAYVVVVLILQRNNTATKHNLSLLKIRNYSFLDILKVIGGTLLLFLASNSIVDETLYFAEAFHIAPFYISLLVLSLGTNLPELTIALRAVVAGKKDIAFGEYLGSAAANTFLFGIFTLMVEGQTLIVDNFLSMFVLITIGLLLFFQFSRTKRTISPKEGFVLVSIYVLFIILEIVIR